MRLRLDRSQLDYNHWRLSAAAAAGWILMRLRPGAWTFATGSGCGRKSLQTCCGRMRSIEPFEKGPNSLLERLDRTKAGKGN